MAVELAKAYVQIVPSLRGAEGKIAKDLGAVTKSPSVSSTGKKLGSKIVSGMGTVIRRGMITTGVAAGGVLATALTKGFGRLTAFEQAKASLEGMGLSAQQVATVMENANKAVEGTAFGLDEAATAAKGMVAAGLEPGQELERVLGLIGDTAAQSGTSMSEMGVLWQQVAAKGRLQGEEALQLMERGIPIYQLVADQLGVTAEEAMELGQQGKISFEMFAEAIEGQFAGSALRMGETVKGSFANVGAALGRLGQGILAGPFADLPGFFMGVTQQINNLTPVVTDASEKTYTALKGVWSILQGADYSPRLNQVLGEINADRSTASLVLLRDTGKDVAGSLRSSIGLIGERFTWLDNTATLNNALSSFDRFVSWGGQVVAGLGQIAVAFAPVVSYGAQAVGILGGGFANVVGILTPSLINLGEALGDAASILGQSFVPFATATVTVLDPLARIVANVVDVVAGLPGPVVAAGLAFALIKTNVGPLPRLVRGLEGALKVGASAWVRFSGDAQLAARRSEILGRNIVLPSQNFLTLGNNVVGASSKLSGFSGFARKAGASLKAAFAGNAVGLAVTGLITVFSLFSRESQETKAYVDQLAAAFGDLGDSAEESARKVVAQRITELDEYEDFVAVLGEAGYGIDVLTDALMGNADAQRIVNDVLAENEDLTRNGTMGTYSRVEVGKDLINVYEREAGTVSEARAEQERYQAALGDTSGTDAASDATSDYGDEVKNTYDAISAVIDAEQRRRDQLLGVRNDALAAREAQRSFNEAVENAAEVIANGESTYDERQAALDRIAEATQRNTVAAAEAGASQAELDALVDQGKAAFYEQAEAAGMNADEINRLWNEIGMLPGEVVTRADVDAEAAWVTLGDLQLGIDSTSGEVTINGDPTNGERTLASLEQAIDNGDGTVTINGESYPADKTLNGLMSDITSSTGSVTIDGKAYPATSVLNLTLQAIRGGRESVTIGAKSYKAIDVLSWLKSSVRGTSENIKIGARESGFYSAVGGLRSWASRQTAWIPVKATPSIYADGGIATFANGSEHHVAQIGAPGRIRIWNEPETGGEAYIPLAAAKRARSTSILAEVARRFGYELAPLMAAKYAEGGVDRPGSYPYRGGAQIHIGQIVNPVAEPTSVSANKELQRAAALTGGLL